MLTDLCSTQQVQEAPHPVLQEGSLVHYSWASLGLSFHRRQPWLLGCLKPFHFAGRVPLTFDDIGGLGKSQCDQYGPRVTRGRWGRGVCAGSARGTGLCGGAVVCTGAALKLGHVHGAPAGCWGAGSPFSELFSLSVSAGGGGGLDTRIAGVRMEVFLLPAFGFGTCSVRLSPGRLCCPLDNMSKHFFGR